VAIPSAGYTGKRFLLRGTDYSNAINFRLPITDGMFFQTIHRFFPFGHLLRLLIGLAIGLQIIVITYNHLSGYYLLHDVQHFLFRLLRGSLLSLLAGLLIAYPDLMAIRRLNRIAPWGSRPLVRIALQLSFAVLVAVIISTAITLFANWLSPYTEEFTGVLKTNAILYSVVNVLLMAVLEGWIFYAESRRAGETAEYLRNELAETRFEVLKSQINPHFMFNSLNVLSALIATDPVKAQEFIDEFSHIYRYVLESLEQPVSTLEKELSFMRSYLYLQQIRHGGNLSYTVNVNAGLLGFFLPPLSLQVVLENAIKHNIVNDDRPLHIDVFSEGEVIVLKNHLQPVISRGTSTGLGLKNLQRRYALVSDQAPDFRVVEGQYVVRLPLINPELDEGAHR
jgi:two-component system, LytTR family, sensor kinase